MVQMTIDLGDVGLRPVTSGRALSLAAPTVRGSVTGNRVIGTKPYHVATVNGLATVTVEPGPLLVQLLDAGGVGDSKARRVVVPNRNCTLREVLEDSFVYEPEVVSDARAAANAAAASAQRAEVAAQEAEEGTVPNSAVATALQTGEAKAVLDGNYAPVSRAAKNPDEIAVGAITRSASGAATAFGVVWDDGATGQFTGTESTAFPGAIDAYTVTHVLGGVTTTYTQPALTRDANGAVTARPGITVS